MTMTKKISYWITLCCMAVVFVCFMAASAYAFKIIPPRLVIKPDQKVVYLYIKNSSARSETYRFGWKHVAMTKDGDIVNLEKEGMDTVPAYKKLDDFVRFSPRRATLKSGDTLRVTFLVSRPADLEDGEYRSHFLIEREPPVTEKTEIAGGVDTEETQVSIGINTARAMPIYMLNGETNASLEITSADLRSELVNKEQKKFVYFNVKKDGNRSVIAVADVFCTMATGEEKISGPGKLFAVYAEADSRLEKALVNLPASGCNKMRLEIHAHRDDVLSGQKLGELAVTQ